MSLFFDTWFSGFAAERGIAIRTDSSGREICDLLFDGELRILVERDSLMDDGPVTIRGILMTRDFDKERFQRQCQAAMEINHSSLCREAGLVLDGEAFILLGMVPSSVSDAAEARTFMARFLKTARRAKVILEEQSNAGPALDRERGLRL